MTNDDTCGSGNNNFLETQLPKKAMDKGTSSSSSDSSSSSNSSSSSKSSSSSNTSSDTDNSSQHSKTDTDPYGSDDSIADPPFNPPVIKRQVKITTGNAIKKRKLKIRQTMKRWVGRNFGSLQLGNRQTQRDCEMAEKPIYLPELFKMQTAQKPNPKYCGQLKPFYHPAGIKAS
ncbi:vitellogenin-1-like [Diabrotica virgifera virgifera]|uniref:Suppressor protein SRP40-like n=1 Tax=Diabrotica virgifera virgifera TaxID=50390 RepID=A0ABM5K5K2_DIAVI|nr:vitellogenin-1-like [Diabrotica virgifera virgifera]